MTDPPRTRKRLSRPLLLRWLLRGLALVWLGSGGTGAAAPPRDSGARQTLVKAILSAPGDQPALLAELANSDAKVVREVLTAWSRDSLYLWDAPDGAKVPVLLEDQPDADGKARAGRVDDGQFLKDPQGKELRFAANDLASCTTKITVPTGGRELAIWNTEGRFPIPGANDLGISLLKDLGGVIFYDGGNVYNNIGFKGFIRDYSNTVGFGLRIQTPVGPVRLDIGHNLNPVPGLNPTQFFVTLGQSF